MDGPAAGSLVGTELHPCQEAAGGGGVKVRCAVTEEALVGHIQELNSHTYC